MSTKEVNRKYIIGAIVISIAGGFIGFLYILKIIILDIIS